MSLYSNPWVSPHPIILELVLNYLSIAEKVSCRLVNKVWKNGTDLSLRSDKSFHIRECQKNVDIREWRNAWLMCPNIRNVFINHYEPSPEFLELIFQKWSIRDLQSYPLKIEKWSVVSPNLTHLDVESLTFAAFKDIIRQSRVTHLRIAKAKGDWDWSILPHGLKMLDVICHNFVNWNDVSRSPAAATLQELGSIVLRDHEELPPNNFYQLDTLFVYLRDEGDIDSRLDGLIDFITESPKIKKLNIRINGPQPKSYKKLCNFLSDRKIDLWLSFCRTHEKVNFGQLISPSIKMIDHRWSQNQTSLSDIVCYLMVVLPNGFESLFINCLIVTKLSLEGLDKLIKDYNLKVKADNVDIQSIASFHNEEPFVISELHVRR